MDRKLIEEFDKKQKSNKRKRNKDSSSAPGSSKHKQVKDGEDHEFAKPSTSYRDRAKERREGINKDFELDPDDLTISNPTVDSSQQDTNQEIDEAERRRQQIEDSKYLGGDVEHTHLVKGLDFALLEKVKNDQKLAEKLAGESGHDRDLVFGDPDSDSEEEEFRNEAILAASSTSSSKRHLVDIEKLKKGRSTEIIPCRTAVARRILNVLDEKWPVKSELFMPGRMIYIISIDEEIDDPVTTILRSKANATNQDDSDLNETDFALDQLVNILSKIRRNGSSNTDSSKKVRSWERDEETDDYGC